VTILTLILGIKKFPTSTPKIASDELAIFKQPDTFSFPSQPLVLTNIVVVGVVVVAVVEKQSITVFFPSQPPVTKDVVVVVDVVVVLIVVVLITVY